MTEYRHRASGVTAIAEISRTGGGITGAVTTRIELHASSDPKVPASPFAIVERTQLVRENPKNPREYSIPNGYTSDPLVLGPEQLAADWVPIDGTW